MTTNHTRKTTIRIAGLVCACATASMSIAACTPPSQKTSQASSSGSSDSSSNLETLTIYSNSLADGRDKWLIDNAKKAGFNLQLVSLGGAAVQNRLLAEKNNPLADVAYGLNKVFFSRLKKQGVLEAYTPTWANKVDKKLGDDKDGQFWPIVKEPILLVCADKAPIKANDWPDLWTNPAFHNKYEVPSTFTGATTQIVLTGILSRYKKDGGDLGVSQQGWDAVSKYFKNGNKAVQGTDLYARMKNNQVYCGQMWVQGKVTREQQYGIKTTAAHPAIGVPMVAQQIALIKGSKHQATAKKFIDWFGSAKVQGAWSKQFFTAPTNKDAMKLGDPRAISFTNSFKAQDIDWAWVADELPEWMKKIELQYAK